MAETTETHHQRCPWKGAAAVAACRASCPWLHCTGKVETKGEGHG